MLCLTKHTKSRIIKNKWKKIIDFTKINKGGVDIDAIFLSFCRDKNIAAQLEKLADLAIKKYPPLTRS